MRRRGVAPARFDVKRGNNGETVCIAHAVAMGGVADSCRLACSSGGLLVNGGSYVGDGLVCSGPDK